mmetsp:Transcript_17768/g.67087  ORF Transcript_17768/g.67087 Transcript_17768/m.67087 type:complete len:231 (+) Transcript_17768:782-1474(+)
MADMATSAAASSKAPAACMRGRAAATRHKEHRSHAAAVLGAMPPMPAASTPLSGSWMPAIASAWSRGSNARSRLKTPATTHPSCSALALLLLLLPLVHSWPESALRAAQRPSTASTASSSRCPPRPFSIACRHMRPQRAAVTLSDGSDPAAASCRTSDAISAASVSFDDGLRRAAAALAAPPTGVVVVSDTCAVAESREGAAPSATQAPFASPLSWRPPLLEACCKAAAP